MRKTALTVFVGLIVLAAAACQNSVTGPSAGSPVPQKVVSGESTTDTDTTTGGTGITGLFGTWEATKAEGWRAVAEGAGFVEVPGSRRDLVAQGGKVTLVLLTTDQKIGYGNATPSGAYTITVTVPGAPQGVDTGFWVAGPAWQENYKGLDQIDFYPARLLPDIEYGEIPAFLYSLSGGSLKLWDSGLSFLPYDFGWSFWQTGLAFEFVRR